MPPERADLSVKQEAPKMPLWVKVLGIAALLAVTVVGILHLAGIPLRH